MTHTQTFTLNDGNRIPWLGFGTGTALYGQDAKAQVIQALENGIVHLDGAQMYGNEASLGDGIKASGRPRDQLFVTTKLNLLESGKTVEDALKVSLQQLQLDYVDLFLIHDPTKHNDIGEVWKQMEGVKAKGLTKSIGVSNFTVEHLQSVLQVATTLPAINQIEYHAYTINAAQPILDLCKKNNILMASYGGQSPIARAPGGPLDPVLEDVRSRIERDYGKPVSAGQVIARWLNQKGIVVIMTTSKVSRLKEYLDSPSIPALTEEEIKAIDEAGAKTHKRMFMKHIFNE